MAFKHGRNTAIYFNGKDVSTYLNDAGIDVDVDTSDTTTFQASWKTALAGQSSAKLGFQGLYDPTLTDLAASVGVDYGANILTYCPAGGLAVGDRARLVSVATTSYSESSPVGGVVAVKWNVLASGVVGFGDVLHVFGEDTNTTTGATKDDTASTSIGWLAQLHVTLVDAGSWVIKLQDASASNFSDGADVTGGSFTAVTTAGGQRLVASSPTATLRRYVRYVATRTGGSAGDGITFFLAYARGSAS